MSGPCPLFVRHFGSRLVRCAEPSGPSPGTYLVGRRASGKASAVSMLAVTRRFRVFRAMLDRQVLRQVGTFFVEHPRELLRIARNAAGLKLGVPLPAVRWLLNRAGASTPGAARRAPTDVVIDAVPPGVRIAATVELMGARLRVSALVFVEGVRLGSDQLRLELRVTEVSISLLSDSESPLAALIRSGALDLTRVGDLVAVMPRRPSFLVEARGDRISLDLKRHPALAGQRVETLLGLLTPLLNLKGVVTDQEHLDFEFSVLEKGFGAAVAAWRSLLNL